MTGEKRELLSRYSETGLFGIAQTDPIPIHHLSASESGQDDAALLDAFNEKFPELLTADVFWNYAGEQMEPHLKFCVLIFRAEHSDKTLSLLVALAHILESFYIDRGGAWGLADDLVLAYYLPDAHVQDALGVAKKIQALLKSKQEGCVSIGIASYPSINYRRDQIHLNARKALDHAAFFSLDAVVAFDAVTLNISADQRYQKGDVLGAIEDLNAALMIDPSNVNVRNSLGACYAELGSMDSAQAEFETVIWLDPEDAMAHYNYGLICKLKGQEDEALESFLEADDVGEELFDAIYQIGKIYLDREKHAKAFSYFERADKINSKSARVSHAMGRCLSHLGHPQKAISAFKKAIRINPNDADSLSRLGMLLDQCGENAEIAVIFCKQSIDINPEEGRFFFRLGSIYHHHKQYQKALEAFESAMAKGHESSAEVRKMKSLLKAESVS